MWTRRGKIQGALWLAPWLAAVACQASPEREPFTDSAQVYEDYYVPALFGPWAVRVADAAEVTAGDRVLDIACGTGVVAREVAGRIGPQTVVGLDIDEGMLAVARGVAPEITWRQGDAQRLPFPDDSFDVVVCQFGLMFFDDQVASIREMLRVAKPNGRIVVAVWGPLEHSPGYAALTRLLERELGAESTEMYHKPFSLGDPGELRRLFAAAGAPDVSITTEGGVARFPSLQSWVETEIRGWIAFSQAVDPAEVDRLIEVAERELTEYAAASGEVEIAIEAHLARVVR